MMYHITQAVDRLYYQRVFVCFGDTDVFKSLIFHFETQWKRKQINKLWVVHRDQVSPVLKAITSLDPSLAYILPAVHALTGCDTTSKISTKASAFRVAKEEHYKQYLKDFLMKELDHDLCLKVEHF